MKIENWSDNLFVINYNGIIIIMVTYDVIKWFDYEKTPTKYQIYYVYYIPTQHVNAALRSMSITVKGKSTMTFLLKH
jgi:hypothetical protein